MKVRQLRAMRVEASAPERRGLTLMELVIAAGLASILMVAVFRLIDSGFRIWNRGEGKRVLVEQSSALSQIFARDLRTLHGGRRGDLIVEWASFDSDGDGSNDSIWPRMRLIRQASAPEVARLMASPADLVKLGLSPPGVGAEQGGEYLDSVAAKKSLTSEALEERTLRRRSVGPALIEVAWCVLPVSQKKDLRADGVLFRGERLVMSGAQGSYFRPGFFDERGRPPVGSLEEVTGGLLWCGVALAKQTTLIDPSRSDGGWDIGTTPGKASACWDAWQTGRLDEGVHEWNSPAVGMPTPGELPALPRQVRLEIEFERPLDRRRRTRTIEVLDASVNSFDVSNGERIPPVGRHIKVGPEWMQVTGRTRDRIRVKRGQRGTEPVHHDAGLMVHWGVPVITEVRVDQFNDSWDLR